jgi:hypothetical protein
VSGLPVIVMDEMNNWAYSYKVKKLPEVFKISSWWLFEIG